jgi:hypothetical protein
MNSRSVGIFAVVVVALISAAIWFLYSDYAPHAVTQPEPVVTTTTPKTAPPTPPSTTTPPSPRPSPDSKPAPAVTNPPPAPTPMALTEDDRKIDETLRMFPGNTEKDHTNTAQALINLLPTLSSDGQVEAAQHVSNLLSDEEYGRVMHIWRNPAFNSEVIDVFATDLMNREHKVMLPAMLDAVKLPNHPFHDEAKTTLEVFLDEDYGNDIQKWDKAMKDFLKKEAEEAGQQ